MSDEGSSGDRERTDPAGENCIAWVGQTGVKAELSMDEVFDVLADERRRRLLSYLHARDDDVASLVELIDYLVAHEAESMDDLEADDVAISLYHVHLPKLADFGLVEYDMRSLTIRYRGDDSVGSLLEMMGGRGRK